MIYFIDWFRVVCSNCGFQIEYPLSDFDNYGLATKLAELIHDRDYNNKYRACSNPQLISVLVEKMDRVEL